MLEGVKIDIRRRKRKTVSIYIERDGSVSLYVPESLTEQEIEAILCKQEYQIHKYLAKRELLNLNRMEREAVNGQAFLYLGRNYHLQFSEDAREIKLKGGRFLVPAATGRDAVFEQFKEYYRARGKAFIPPRVELFAEKMGLFLEEVAILELKNRWASCSMKKAKINLHWKAMMAPVSVVDYLIVHELAHLKHQKHDKAFWNEVDKVLPGYQNQVDWLKRYGAALSL